MCAGDTTYKICHIIRYVQLAINALNMDSEETIKIDNIWIDVVRTIYKVMNSDSEKVKSLVESIKGIDKSLKSHERDQMLYTNALVCTKFPEIIFAQNSGILRVSREFMQVQPISVLCDSLKAIGMQLHNAIIAEKAIQALQEVGKTVIKSAIDNCIYDDCGLYQM